MKSIRICYKKRAVTPYVIPTIGKKIFTIEELCFYYWQYAHLIDENAVDDEVIEWLEDQLDLGKTAQELRNAKMHGEDITEQIRIIFASITYLDPEEESKYLEHLSAMKNMSEFERSKHRADDLVRNCRYYKAIQEYRQLLQCEEAEDETVASGIYHNLGVAYCKMFFFREGSECFLKAFLKAPGKENLRKYKLALQLCEEPVQEDELVREFPSSATMDLQVYEEIGKYKQMKGRRMDEFEQLQQKKKDGNVVEYYAGVEQILHDWKDACREYMNMH